MSSSNTVVRRIAMLGATQGCALEALKVLLNRPADAERIHVYTLVRNEDKLRNALREAGFDIAKVFESAQAKSMSTTITAVKGDALQKESVRAFFEKATQDGPLSDVVSSIGSTSLVFVWYKPLSPPQFPSGTENICSDSMRNIVEALQQVVAPRQPDHIAPRLTVISSNAIGKSGHDALPALLKPFYGNFLKYPHLDKEKMERYLHEQYAIQSDDFNKSPNVSPAIALDRSRIIIVRPSLLTNGEPKHAIRASVEPVKSAWTISRKDVGAFVAGDCMKVTKMIVDEPIQGGRGYTITY